jgi:hypothetical protein
MAIEDLLGMPADRPIVAEGYGFLPNLVLPLLLAPQHAIWLISSDEFKRASYARRGKGEFATTTAPARARHNHIERDLLLAELNRRRAIELGLATIAIDGTLTLDEVVDLVAAQFRTTG